MPKGLKGFQKGHVTFKGAEKGYFKKDHKINQERRVRGEKVGFQKGHLSYNTPESNKKIGETLKGNQNAWKGGITPLNNQIRQCFKYRQWRSDVFTRDDFTCQECGKRGGCLEVDHYPKSFSDIFYKNEIKTLEQALDCEEFWNINNGRTLCLNCHKKTKNYGKKHKRNNHSQRKA